MNSHMCHMITQYRNLINELTNQLNLIYNENMSLQKIKEVY